MTKSGSKKRSTPAQKPHNKGGRVRKSTVRRDSRVGKFSMEIPPEKTSKPKKKK